MKATFLSTLALASLAMASPAPAPDTDSPDARDLEPLPAFTPDGVPIIDLRTGGANSSMLSKRADCQNSPGVANGACVRFGYNYDCTVKSGVAYKPTCGGNCYVYDYFNKLLASGDGTYGTNCHVFEDLQCQNEKQSTGNAVVGVGKCIATSGLWRSMKCYYRC